MDETWPAAGSRDFYTSRQRSSTGLLLLEFIYDGRLWKFVSRLLAWPTSLLPDRKSVV